MDFIGVMNRARTQRRERKKEKFYIPIAIYLKSHREDIYAKESDFNDDLENNLFFLHDTFVGSCLLCFVREDSSYNNIRQYYRFLYLSIIL